ncbi:alpha/beta hydrolase [Celeribacter sp.]|uniref:alpha/beta hydrolase n=1 Tax=Celeribacter sp. TaxID=1890673 RepID=UPI003A917003
MSLRMRIIGGALRPVIRAALARKGDPIQLRRKLERRMRHYFHAPPFARFDEVHVGGRRALWVLCGPALRQPATDSRVILYLHGGGYIAGSPETHKKMVARLSKMTGLRVFLPSYRLAPEYPLPAALDDVRAAWDHLIALGYAPADIILGGDSAGGGLAFSLLSQLCQAGTPPRAAFGWSPFLDQTFSGESVQENAQRDHFFPASRLHDLTVTVLGDMAASDPYVSPLFAEFPDCPPVLLQVSDCEILRDDSMRMEAKLRARGAEVLLQTYVGAPHAWQLFDGWFPEAREAIGLTADFIQVHATPQRGS